MVILCPGNRAAMPNLAMNGEIACIASGLTVPFVVRVRVSYNSAATSWCKVSEIIVKVQVLFRARSLI